MPDELYTNMVKNLQRHLNQAAKAGLDPDGSLGGKTLRAAQAYERSIAIVPKRVSSGQPRIAHCLHKLRAQIDAMHPDRNKAADGWIGDAAHSARKSDHNAKKVGKEKIVFALDITHDPEHGVDCEKLSHFLQVDSRVKYLIWNAQIFNPTVSPNWRKYDGQNAHRHHIHISVTDEADEDVRDWRI